MNQRKSNKKLTLTTESVRTLRASELAIAAGGKPKATGASCVNPCGGGGGGGGGSEDTFYDCWDSYLACYF